MQNRWKTPAGGFLLKPSSSATVDGSPPLLPDPPDPPNPLYLPDSHYPPLSSSAEKKAIVPPARKTINSTLDLSNFPSDVASSTANIVVGQLVISTLEQGSEFSPVSILPNPNTSDVILVQNGCPLLASTTSDMVLDSALITTSSMESAIANTTEMGLFGVSQPGGSGTNQLNDIVMEKVTGAPMPSTGVTNVSTAGPNEVELDGGKFRIIPPSTQRLY